MVYNKGKNILFILGESGASEEMKSHSLVPRPIIDLYDIFEGNIILLHGANTVSKVGGYEEL